MKRNHYLFTLILLLGCSIFVKASDTVFVHQTQIPILIERQDNVLFYFRLDAKESRILEGVSICRMYRLSNSIMAVRKLYKIEERTDLHLLIISPVTVRGIHWQQYHLIR